MGIDKIAQALMGFGAGVQGQLPQFLAQRQKLDENRRQALLADNRRTISLLQSGATNQAIDLLNDRVKRIQQLGGDPSDTISQLQLLQNGDVKGALNNALSLDAAAVSRGVLKPMPGPSARWEPVKDSSGNIVAQRNTSTGEVKSDPRAKGAPGQDYSKSPGTIVELEDGTKAYSIPVMNKSTGKIENQVVPITGQLVSRMGESAEAETLRKILLARETERAERGVQQETAAGIKSEEARGAETSKRQQGFIESGIVAGDALPNLRRSLELLDQVKTGGIDYVSNEAKRLFGVQGADEAELSNRLGKAVLSQLRSTFGAAFTEREGARLQAMEAGFGKSTAGNKRILEQALKTTERAIRRGIKAAKAAGDDFSVQEMESALKNVKEKQEEATKPISEMSDEELRKLAGQ